ncbi:MAG: hypothetical protein ACD_79C00784G0002 [uncultured bacterium]|nr:MAG: hypothetical protein ACD_79C00784G0002 [uncultured bacterium]
MLLDAVILLFGLLLILFAAEFFTNGIEVIGHKYELSQAVVGSVLAAVGTALPETILPVVAILFSGNGTGHEIGIGAILGAPFMLSTLAMLLIGTTAFILYLKKKRGFVVNIEIESATRDLTFFIILYSSAVFIPAIFPNNSTSFLAVLLIAGYAYYIYRTTKGTSDQLEHYQGLHLLHLQNKIFDTEKNDPHFLHMITQVILSLIVMVIGAHVFVNGIKSLSLSLGFNPLLFSLIIAPIATELPEKFNSITWTLKGKDTLALGNITGAMVFQSTFPVSIGLIYTEWNLTGMSIFSAVISLLSAIFLLCELKIRKKITPLSLMSCGSLYLVYIIVLIIKN